MFTNEFRCLRRKLIAEHNPDSVYTEALQCKTQFHGKEIQTAVIVRCNDILFAKIQIAKKQKINISVTYQLQYYSYSTTFESIPWLCFSKLN